MLGAKNSALGESLYDVGYHSLVLVDSNENAVKKVATRNESVRPEMAFDSMETNKVHVKSYRTLLQVLSFVFVFFYIRVRLISVMI